MNLEQLRPIQAELDNRIVEEHGLVGKDLTANKTVALITELYETVNDSRFFKFWSHNKQPKPSLLEEYTDTVHFALSLANDMGLSEYQYTEPEDNDLNVLTIGLTNMITRLPVEKNIEQVLNYLVKLGYQLGFTEEDVISEYYRKNEINHDRQESGVY